MRATSLSRDSRQERLEPADRVASTCFAAVLTSERERLSSITDAEALATWRRVLVQEVMTPQSPYSLALRGTDEHRERAAFLDQWSELIAQMVHRVAHTGTGPREPGRPTANGAAAIDSRKTAVLILATLHGGSTLTQLSQDALPLDAALRLALAPLAAGAKE